MIAKFDHYRNKKFLQAAKNYPCQFCGADDGTVVAAHYQGMYSNKVGKGAGIKAHDAAIAYLCHYCHDILDSRNNCWPQAEKIALFAVACANTHALLHRERDLIEQEEKGAA